ncbi:MAG: helix-turn-helix domain-containing protein [Oscillospiraceae bacterium]|nr:helix-turn-helix domain-containing protein [Oscillospiraceae bacterium]
MVTGSYELHRKQDTYYNEVLMHHHDFYEVNLFLKGEVDYSIENRIYHATPGDMLLISPNELHQPIFEEQQPAFERMVLWVDRAYLTQTASFGHALSRCFDRAAERGSNLLRPDQQMLGLMVMLLENILTERQSEEYAHDLLADTCLLQFLVMLNRLEERSSQHPAFRERSGSVVGRVLSYINDHYREELSLDLLANRFFISKYHLSREFNRLVGTSVYRYIIQKRLVMAKQMLSEGISSSEAYQQCGFGDYSSFYRAFRAEYGISPKEYVDKLKSDAAQAALHARERRSLAKRAEQSRNEAGKVQ